MLDAVVCDTDGSSNCYNNPTAINATAILVENEIFRYSLPSGVCSGGLWTSNNTGRFLINDVNGKIIETTDIDANWACYYSKFNTASPRLMQDGYNYYISCTGVKNRYQSPPSCSSGLINLHSALIKPSGGAICPQSPYGSGEFSSNWSDSPYKHSGIWGSQGEYSRRVCGHGVK